jgi:diguanylate cyclase (GGDEF)-like protein/PAS domain S-box-containing protein
MNILIIADSHSEFQILRNMIEQFSDCSILMEHADLPVILQRLNQNDKDIAVLVLPLAGRDHFESLRQIRRQAPHAAVIALIPEEPELIAPLLQNGAQDVLLRTSLTPQVLLHSIRCVPERKRLEEQLTLSETRYQTISELISDFACSIRCDPEDRYTVEWITGPVHRLLAAPVVEIDLITDWRKYIHPDDLSSVQAHIHKVRTGEPDSIEFRVCDQNGKTRWIYQRTCPVRNENNGRVEHIYGAGSEITERKALEARQRQDEDAYRALVQNSLQELLIKQDGRIVLANPAAVENSGYSLIELQSLSAATLLETIHPDDVDEAVSIEDSILTGNLYPDRQELRIIQKNGAVRWVEAQRTCIEYQGHPAVQTVQFDITERKLAEERLRYRHAIEGLVTSISTRFINHTSETIDSGIRQSLQSLGRFAGVDRCYVYLLSSDFTRFEDGYEWSLNGLKSRIDQLRDTSFEPYAWSLSYFKDRQPVYVPCVAEIGPDALPEKELWQSDGIQSVLAIPMILNNMLFGFWGFDSIQKPKTWTEEDIRLLRMMGDVFVNALARKQTELALRQARQELDLTLNSISDALWTGEMDSDGNLQYRFMSPVMEKITGRKNDYFKPSKKAWFNIIHPDDTGAVKEAWKRLQKDQLHYIEVQFRIILPDGGIRWVRESMTGTRLSNQRIRLDAVLSDITEQKRAEEELRQRYAIEGLITTLTTRFINVESGEVDRQIQSALQAIGEFTGLDRCYIVMLSPDGYNIDSRYDWAVADSSYVGPYMSLKPYNWAMSILRRFETLYVPRMDELPPEAAIEKEYWLSRGIRSILNIPLVMDDRLIGYFGFASDAFEKEWAEEDIRLLRLMGDVFTNVLARRKAEEALIEREAQYRLLADGITDIVALHELNGSIVYISPSAEKITGRSPADLMGVLPAEVILPEDWLPVKHAVDSRLSQGQDLTIQWRCLSIDGSYIWMETSLHPIFKEDRPFRYLSTSRNITERKQAEEALYEANQQLQVSIVEMEQRNQEVTLLNEMGDLLQGCLSVLDVYQIVEVYCPRLFEDFSGALLMTNPSRKQVEAMAAWGGVTKKMLFKPDQCWALRRGRIHSVNLNGPDLVCEHVRVEKDMAYLCIPMAAQGETLGVFYLQGKKEQFLPRQQQLAIMLAERLSLALSNLRLRDILQRQSIRDALTGLYNRRYMETTVERELRQAARQKEPIGFIMMDLDHFKDFNDTYGHGAGDLLLTALGEYLQNNIRAGDIACRYGGDEFVLILPQASINDTCERAEELREGIKKLAMDFGSTNQGEVTVSMGVAAYPDHGFSMDRLLSIADKALYRAKNIGRDRIAIAPVIG